MNFLYRYPAVLSGMFIPDPDFVHPESRIPDPGSRIRDPKTAKKERSENICCSTFFVATNITKLKIVLFLNWSRKKFGPIYKEYRTFYPKKMS
jgi:hypothetical protein